jgi:hypothetical protein
MKRVAAVAVLALTLAGCSHSLTFVGRSTGQVGKADITTYGVPNGTMDIHLNGKVYTGTWAMVRDGEVAIGSGRAHVTASGPGGTATADVRSTSTTTIMAQKGDGMIVAVAPDGSTIRCRFVHSGLSGYGECVDNAGEVYDVIIRG